MQRNNNNLLTSGYIISRCRKIILRKTTEASATLYEKTEAKLTVVNISVSHVFIIADYMIAHVINLNMGQLYCCRTTKIITSDRVVDVGAYGGNL